MTRSALVGNVNAMLADAGFQVSDRCAIRPKSFDVAARRGEDLVLLKILGNVDAFDAETGAEMRRIGTYLGATPLVIGMRSRDEDLKPGVVYFRHGVPAFHPETAFELFVEEVPPLIYAAPGGLYVSIDSTVLADAREKRGWSLGRLAKELGVSRRTVSKYEDGMNASIDVAMHLEELFERPLSSPIEVLEDTESVHSSDPTPEDPEADPDDVTLIGVLRAAGFDVHPTRRAPFKAVSEDNEETILTGHSTYTKTAEKRARIMGSLGRVTRTQSIYFVDSAKQTSVDGTAIIEREEIEHMDDPDDLRRFIRERTEPETEA